MEDKGYEQICNNYHQLTDVRFKLLAFVPAIAGTAIALISNDLSAFKASPLPRLIVAILGFLVTLGIFFYDQRNSQLYNALVKRGKKLEEELNINGVFSQRQARSLKLFGLVTIWHDRGLSLIYGSVLGAWVFPIACGVQWLWNTQLNTNMTPTITVPTIAAILALMTCIIFILEIHRLDKKA
ncbi:MAG: hypothetical protein OEY38_23205 [Gammaproteobacteria bacterium]|nr:hypothetical protein [Gammaproteobacteria bacterium]